MYVMLVIFYILKISDNIRSVEIGCWVVFSHVHWKVNSLLLLIAYSTQCSQAVYYLSTNQAWSCLTSEIRWDQAHSECYDRTTDRNEQILDVLFPILMGSILTYCWPSSWSWQSYHQPVLAHENSLHERVSESGRKFWGITMEHSLRDANVHGGTGDRSIRKNTNINNCVKQKFRRVGL